VRLSSDFNSRLDAKFKGTGTPGQATDNPRFILALPAANVNLSTCPDDHRQSFLVAGKVLLNPVRPERGKINRGFNVKP
jgi:hypothetical protein